MKQIFPCDLTAINKMMPDGKLQPRPFEWLMNNFNRNTIEYFMYVNGLYILPTVELIEHLRRSIIGSAIEICAGNGSLGRALNIPATDNLSQTHPIAIAQLKLMQQPPVRYGDDVIGLDAIKAIYQYRPQTVIGSFVTSDKNAILHGAGIQEERIFEVAKRYIMIGNLDVHANKPLMMLPHSQFSAPWIVTRCFNQDHNRIFTWNK